MVSENIALLTYLDRNPTYQQIKKPVISSSRGNWGKLKCVPYLTPRLCFDFFSIPKIISPIKKRLYALHSHGRIRAQNDITLTTTYKTNLSSSNLELTVINDRFINYTYENGDVMLIYFGFKRPHHRAHDCNQVLTFRKFCISHLLSPICLKTCFFL